MATITIPASGAVQVRIRYTMENITDGSSYGKTKITITGMDASNATGIAVGYGKPAFGVKVRIVSTDTLTDSLYEFSGTSGSVPSVPLGSGFSGFPGLSSASVTVARTARNENFQFLITKYAGFGGGGWNPCFVYGSPSKPLYLGNQLSAAPWGSSEIAMPDAATASTLTVSSGIIGSPLTIAINRASTAFTHKLSYSFGGASGVISENAATSVSWTPDIGLCSQIPNAVSGLCTLTCDTYNGSALVGTSAANIWLSCPAWVAPSVAEGWANVGYVNTGTPAANMACFVQGYSRAKVTLDSTKVTHSYGATTASTKISFGGADYADTTPVLTASGQQSIVVTLTDSRGRTASQSLSFSVLPYSKPVLYGVEVFRCLSDGTADDSGTSFSAKASVSFSDLGGENRASLTVKYKVSGGSFGGSTAIQPDTPYRFDGILTTATYVVRITAADELGQSSYNDISIPTASVGMHIRPGHDGAAFGKYCERANALELPEGWDIYFGDKKVTFRNPRNLLDNSDFRNPVNQRGITSGNGYILDRWIFYESSFSGNVTISTNANGTTVTAATGAVNCCILQKFVDKNYDAGKYTMAVKTTGGFLFGNVQAADAANNVYQAVLWFPSGTTIEWAALYEGTYTAETLPEYRCNGYGAELAECQRYYQIRSANNIAAADMRPTMRLSSPTITSVSGGYAYSADL